MMSCADTSPPNRIYLVTNATVILYPSRSVAPCTAEHDIMSENRDNKLQAPPPLPTFDPTNISTYSASCHCGVVSYTVTLSPPLAERQVVCCNCSICQRNGYSLVYPSREHVQLNSGEGALKDYAFGPKKILHKFCSHCGSSVFFDPRMKEFGEGGGLDLIGVNVSHKVLLLNLWSFE